MPVSLWEYQESLLTLYIILGLNLILPIVGIWYIGVFSISEQGMVLKRFNKLKWADILEARKSKFLWFNTIHIKRRKGIPWLLPLYFVGDLSMKEALLRNVPKSNPLYGVALELPNT